MNYPLVAKTNSNIPFSITVLFFDETTGVVIATDKYKSPYMLGNLKNSFNPVYDSNTWSIIDGDISNYIEIAKNISENNSDFILKRHLNNM